MTLPFLMPVEDVFTITGRGTVATGRVERGILSRWATTVEIVGLSDEKKSTVVTGHRDVPQDCWTSLRLATTSAPCCAASTRPTSSAARSCASPAPFTPTPSSSGQVYVLKKEEGGRHTPFFNNYRPQFYFRTTDVTGVITLPEGTEMCMPGDNVEMDVELITPIAIEEGLRFAIREGGRTVGSGVVISVEQKD